jgi:superfamily I DNA and/or RNA helicase
VDEASQIEPIDALGAIARVDQIVVVGDERQLPPTRFFAKLTSDIDDQDEEYDSFAARDAESILDLCLAKGVPHRMLNWHYRSRHQSLIAVSNREFYEDRLFIVPSPYDAVAGMGLKFHHLPQAQYDRGGTRTNPVEAKTIADAVMSHVRQNPNQSLGVATFSVAQRQAIMKELELLRRAHLELEDFFSRESTEPFFVKNLENIQGDERDVIFISVGYGKNASGYPD